MTVTAEQMLAVARKWAPVNDDGAKSAPKPKPRARRGDFDIDAWMAEHFPGSEAERWRSGERRWVLEVCPFDPSHDRGEAFVIEREGGKLGAGCQQVRGEMDRRATRARHPRSAA